jgi:hypothetical protein
MTDNTMLNLDSDNLRSVRGNVRIIRFNCPYDDCGSGISNFSRSCRIDNKLNWLVTLQCHLCNRSWSLCRACRNSNVIYSSSQLSRHERRYHSEKPVNKKRMNSHLK